MKKIITIFSVLVALTFMAGPSYALVGMPDDVPGTNVLQPFFLVDMAGYATDEGLDTLIVITDVSGVYGGSTKNIGQLHFYIYNKKSVHVGDGIIDYTPGDVVSFSVRDLIEDYVAVVRLPELEYDLDGISGNDTYIGYIDWIGTRTDATVDNLIAQVYLVDLANGRAAGTNAPAREDASAVGYDLAQNNSTDFEVFTGDALAMSDYRERANDALAASADLTLTPRWFLKDATATNYLFFWTSTNHGVAPTPDTYLLAVYLWDEDENAASANFNLPYELNIIDVREQLPSGGVWADALGGWFDIPTGDATTEWLAYSYQMAESLTAGLNWSGLFDVHRNIEDFSTH